MKVQSLVLWGSIDLPKDRLSLLDRLFISTALAGILLWAFPHMTAAQVVSETPLVFKINEFPQNQLAGNGQNYLAQVLAPDLPPVPIDPRLESLKNYLESKNSPLAAESEILLKQYHYRLIIGISFAESNFCKKQIMPNNCWGIGGTRPESYPSLADGIIRANNLIQKYQNNGMTTPKLMRTTWVGWHNDSWVIAVDQVTKNLEVNGI